MKKTLLNRPARLKLRRKDICVMGLQGAEPGTKGAETNSIPPILKLEFENNRIVCSGV